MAKISETKLNYVYEAEIKRFKPSSGTLTRPSVFCRFLASPGAESLLTAAQQPMPYEWIVLPSSKVGLYLVYKRQRL